MSLLKEQMVKCILYNKVTVEDGYGGYKVVWNEGVEFDAAIVFNSSSQVQLAMQSGTAALYTVTTPKTINLQYHDIFKRKEDNKIFRVISDGDDNKTPKSATLNMRQVTAEEWKIPNDNE